MGLKWVPVFSECRCFENTLVKVMVFRGNSVFPEIFFLPGEGNITRVSQTPSLGMRVVHAPGKGNEEECLAVHRWANACKALRIGKMRCTSSIHVVTADYSLERNSVGVKGSWSGNFSEILAKTFFNSYTSPLFSELHAAISQQQIMIESSLMAHWKGTFVLFKTVFITPLPFFRGTSHIILIYVKNDVMYELNIESSSSSSNSDSFGSTNLLQLHFLMKIHNRFFKIPCADPMMWRLSSMAMTFPMKFFSSNGFLSNSGSGGNRCFDLSFIFSPVFVTPASAASLYFTIDCDVEQNWQIIPLSRTTWNPFVNESPQTEHCFIAEDSFYVTWDSISVPLLNLGSVISDTRFMLRADRNEKQGLPRISVAVPGLVCTLLAKGHSRVAVINSFPKFTVSIADHAVGRFYWLRKYRWK
ncbi:hypothetical protein ACFE04_000014 [Oxalis oulophora]